MEQNAGRSIDNNDTKAISSYLNRFKSKFFWLFCQVCQFARKINLNEVHHSDKSILYS